MIYIILKLISAFNLIFLYLMFSLFINIKHNTITSTVIQNYYGLFDALYFVSCLLCTLSCCLFMEEINKNKGSFLNINFLTEIKKGKYYFYSLLFDFFYKYFYFLFIKITYLVIKYQKYSLYILFAGIILPSFIIVICLLTEIYLGHFYYYYYSLLLLSFTVIFNIIIYILKNIGPKRLLEFETLIKTIETETTYTFTFKEEYAHLDFEHFWNKVYLPIVFISDFMDLKFLPKYNKIRFFTFFLYFFIHFLCWSYFIFTTNL